MRGATLPGKHTHTHSAGFLAPRLRCFLIRKKPGNIAQEANSPSLNKCETRRQRHSGTFCNLSGMQDCATDRAVPRTVSNTASGFPPPSSSTQEGASGNSSHQATNAWCCAIGVPGALSAEQNLAGGESRLLPVDFFPATEPPGEGQSHSIPVP